jgi:uncharacterized protein (DUF1015 family)
MKTKSFQALRPPAALAAQVASPPYDVVDETEARALAGDNPLSFLRIVRAEVEFPVGTDPYADAIYQRAAENLQHFKARGYLLAAPQPAYYVYQLSQGDHTQSGVVTVSHIDDYDQGLIKRHEKTRKPTEDDRTRHVDTVNANAGPVFLTYRDHAAIDALVADAKKGAPLYQFEAPDGVRHAVWEVPADKAWAEAFRQVPVAYVADGHHRAASAARVARLRRDADTNATGVEEYNWFLTVFFPASQLRVLPYNRVVQDLNGLDAAAFMQQVRERFTVAPAQEAAPQQSGQVAMYLQGAWYDLRWAPVASPDPVASLDVSVLQDQLLAPVLGIDDPRNNPRIAFVGGVRGTAELARRVDSGQAAVAFSMHPVTVDQLMAVADAGLIMPPKSTWFEPKLKSGLLVHELS